ncbi:hypothetical protein [Jiulongibacter sediminis]|uniref:Uncharacterized protein n=1 Tax=Jiulongibacter sediminis TaxID=1605367 RepID=A0A0P7C8R7_9BACT|nr:hypothetical protein [Jiulongibacter sediminis]KPM48906.1 hypothetical protein AFM12_10145 [Jiulongibacter sediminis]TBX25435.1 hypothetical protein TK44_10150 [Jiulongibacter sediminis]
MFDRKKRTEEFDILLKVVVPPILKKYPNVSLDNNILGIVINDYENLLIEGIKPVYNEGVNICIHKVASAFEMAISYQMPLKCSDLKTRVNANLELAKDVAIQLIVSKKDVDFPGFIESFSGFSDQQNALLLKHENYMRISADSEVLFDYNVLLNALFWESFFNPIYENFAK